MSRSRLLRRFVAAAAAGVLALLGPHMALSIGAAADGCAAKHHGCGRSSVTACCCPAPELPDATVPQPAGVSVAQASQNAPTPAPAVTVLAGALEARLATAPTRGFTAIDLPVLLSTFLI